MSIREWWCRITGSTPPSIDTREGRKYALDILVKQGLFEWRESGHGPPTLALTRIGRAVAQRLADLEAAGHKQRGEGSMLGVFMVMAEQEAVLAECAKGGGA